MQIAAMVARDDFTKNSDGSWTCIKNTDVKTSYGIYRVNPGMIFRKENLLWGIDVVELLEQAD